MSRRLFVALLILAMCVPFFGPAAQVDAAAPAVPAKVEAHSIGSSVVVDWEYTYTPTVLKSLKFEVEEYKLSGMIITWVLVGTVTYPIKSLTLEGLTAGQHKFRVRAVETTTVLRPFPLGPITTVTP
ncbi:MAG: hypothetical protein NTZ77_05335, partial [Caldiserica bacterium]|nr:hypothetical protein [Caldisericota bacterium]